MNVAFSDCSEIRPASGIEGKIALPGDKSISHRLAMIGSIARGSTTIRNFAASADSHSTLSCLAGLGVHFTEEGSTVRIEGLGVRGLRQPASALDAGNSGSTVRMLSGILAACPLDVTLIGDASLSSRPMKRIMEPLRRFGARLEARDGNFLPLTVHGGPLSAIQYELPVASAQVKSSILLAGLNAEGITRVVEPIATRNHTELALRQFGADLHIDGRTIEIAGGQELTGQRLTVPGDLSSAAFFIAAALGLPRAQLSIHDVGLNPTRSGFIDLLQEMGARISVESLSLRGGEPAGNLLVENSELAGMEIRGHWIGNVIDEIPVLAVLGARTRNGIAVRDAAELRSKETDRIRAVVDNLRELGVEVEEFEDGLFVRGQQSIHGGVIDSRGDHRIAMAFAIAGLFATAPVTIRNSSCVSVSFPGFFEALESVAKR